MNIWDIHDSFGLSVCEFYLLLWCKIDDINSQFTFDLDIDNEKTLMKVETGIRKKYKYSVLRGAVENIVGFLILHKAFGVDVKKLNRYCCAR